MSYSGKTTGVLQKKKGAHASGVHTHLPSWHFPSLRVILSLYMRTPPQGNKGGRRDQCHRPSGPQIRRGEDLPGDGAPKASLAQTTPAEGVLAKNGACYGPGRLSDLQGHRRRHSVRGLPCW